MLVKYKAVGLAEVLSARSERAAMREKFLEPGYLYLCYSLNIVGEWKRNALYDYFYQVMETRLLCHLAEAAFILQKSSRQDSAAGLWTIYAFSYVGRGGLQTLPYLKKLCCEFEEQGPAYRLLDLDVFNEQGEKLSRAQNNQRACLLCSSPAYECAASRRHSTADIITKSGALILEELTFLYKEKLLQAAEAAMLAEVTLTPKPGLVDTNNSGSHDDMDISSFKRSIVALLPHLATYVDLALASSAELCGGYDTEPDFYSAAGEKLIYALTEQGKKAEKDSLKVNDGVNCHLGLNYAWAYLLPAATLNFNLNLRKLKDRAFPYKRGQSSASLSSPREILSMVSAIASPAYKRWRKEFPASAGGARQSAAEGYPLVLKALDVMSRAGEEGFSETALFCLGLLAIMAENEDSNILRRGSRQDLESIQERSKYLLAKYLEDDESIEQREAHERKESLFLDYMLSFDEDLCEAGLSPGGSADLLAISLFFRFMQDTDNKLLEDVL